MQKQYKRLSVDFPAEEYIYLKMTCVKQGISIKDFVNQAVIRSIEEYEDEMDLKALKQMSEEEINSAIPWDEAEKQLGWDKL